MCFIRACVCIWAALDCGVATAMIDTEIADMLTRHNDQRRRDGADQFQLVSI